MLLLPFNDHSNQDSRQNKCPKMDNVDASSPEIESENNASADARNLGFRVARSIDERLKRSLTTSTECCIYRVLEKCRKVNEEAYTPQLVSIGPLHRDRTQLHSMEDTKLRYLRSFKNRTNADLLWSARVLKENEEQVRQSYQEIIMLSSDVLVEMILVDAIFILELFMRNHDPGLRDVNDEIFDKQWMINGILHDMLLLENQLPFFVLEYLYKHIICNPSMSLLELCYEYFIDVLNVHKVWDMNFKVLHLVDFVRAVQHQSFPLEAVATRRRKFEYPLSITELQEAGVQFKTEKENIKFYAGTLEIPHIAVHELTETFLRNIIAFEQCHHVFKITSSYIIFMESLINTPNDVDILVRYGIIDNQLGDSEDVSTLFNNLYKETIGEASYFCYGDLCQELNAYRRTFWHKLNAKWFQWKVILKRDYFGNPWSIISVIAGVVLLILTIIQTTCSVIAL